MKWRFDINPVAASRPRVSKYGHAYFTGPYKEFRKSMAQLAEAVLGEHKPFQGPLSVVLDIYVTKPKTTKLRSPRGDVDNYAKACLDALNTLMWEDDKQIEHLCISKRWTDGPEQDGWFDIEVIPND